MEIHTVKDETEFVETTNRLLADSVESGSRLYIPAGNTPVPVYKNWENTRPEFLETLRLIQIDEVVSAPAMFRPFLEEHLPSYITQIDWITEGQKQAETALLGLGLNGHVAFHEPHMPADFAFGRVELSDKTCETLTLEQPAYGITYGLGSFLKCKTIIVIVNGANKQETLHKVIGNAPEIPAARLNAHPNVHVVNLST